MWIGIRGIYDEHCWSTRKLHIPYLHISYGSAGLLQRNCLIGTNATGSWLCRSFRESYLQCIEVTYEAHVCCVGRTSPPLRNIELIFSRRRSIRHKHL